MIQVAQSVNDIIVSAEQAAKNGTRTKKLIRQLQKFNEKADLLESSEKELVGY